ncbi:DEK C terminal domain-domain-containing protein [Catenaria anguillulae PL171]|uniref:DEK C terminal domain-domain-containing protein n=1 Tax=Catenaria anguillulae PL171 TaxID=765915 RepID=A0A1Y2H8Z1_9FUNG|nr:DEK C terminal domain-domain-containing protein [Catenaria anguillulae PL171]
MPSEQQLVAAIAEILHGADLMTVTKKGIRGQLEGMFGVDLTEQRLWINAAIDQVLESMS